LQNWKASGKESFASQKNSGNFLSFGQLTHSFFSEEKNLGKSAFCCAKAFFGNLPFFSKERRKEKGRLGFLLRKTKST